ncbi:uncharacterized protein EAF01_011115 [Botrytis porri]|uniref:uncharacterized protein n=1 Tax=Botrytis porri TaxID=87229 RepID=UPI0018FF115C|nr:uncharacterized protein EAF01_011115 [Botrytis porri]KAF7887961.1 hypothetical protein EAF01_011115 [Botrytis porri]
MSSVYGDRVITIAASSARDSSEGCFLEPPDFSGGLRARITDGGRQRVQDFLCQKEYDYSTVEAHVGTRAWALQEKILLPRTIHFEFFPERVRESCARSPIYRTGMFEWQWPQVVQLYSAANLTYENDKLPALPGIAKLEFDENGDQDLAGVWRKKIEEQLCWDLAGCNARERPLWRAPSWSWASIYGRIAWPVLYGDILDTRYAHVVDAGTTPYGHDPFGQVIDGFARLACSTMAAGHIAYIGALDGAGCKNDAAVSLNFRGQMKIFPNFLDCLDDIDQNYIQSLHLVLLIGGSIGFVRKNNVDFGGGKDIVEELYEPFLQVLEEQDLATAEEACSEILSIANPPDHRYLITVSSCQFKIHSGESTVFYQVSDPNGSFPSAALLFS